MVIVGLKIIQKRGLQECSCNVKPWSDKNLTYLSWLVVAVFDLVVGFKSVKHVNDFFELIPAVA